MRSALTSAIAAAIAFGHFLIPVRAAEPPRLVAETPPLTPQEQLQKFHLPPGFRIELIAAEPEVPKPINLNFDARGRLYASCSLEYPYPATGDGTPRDAIKLITDTDGDSVPAHKAYAGGPTNDAANFVAGRL